MFLKGLNAPIRVACTVNPQTGVRFTSLDSLCTYVVQYESNLKSGGMLRGPEGRKVLNVVKRTPTSTPAYFPGFTQGPVLGAVGHTVGGKLDSRTSVPSERQCYFCKNFGHEQWQCQAKRDYLQRKSRLNWWTSPGRTPQVRPTWRTPTNLWTTPPSSQNPPVVPVSLHSTPWTWGEGRWGCCGRGCPLAQASAHQSGLPHPLQPGCRGYPHSSGPQGPQGHAPGARSRDPKLPRHDGANRVGQPE
eukprot:jgi/Botrbrau1/9957/Bobra.0012s0052.1